MAKILIIDDRPVNRLFLTTLLGYQHHQLSEASDGAEGLRKAREQRPDLIISDVLMPTMDGYEFVLQLRADPDIGKTPVVFSTAHYLGRESKALAQKCGVTSIIHKPCEPQAVLDIVAGALGEDPLQLPARLREPEEFDRDHLRLVTNKVAESADELRAAHDKLSALIELSTDLAQERDPVRLLDRICSVAREVIGTRWTMVVLLEPNRKTVQHLGIAGIQLEDSPALRSALLENGVFKTVTQEGRTISLSDVTSTPTALSLPKGLPRAASLLVAPLVMRGHVDGWICLADKLGLDAFTEEDEQLAPALAAQMAVAYANARLYSDSVKYASKLETEISERVKVEGQLSESRAQLTGIIGSAMDSIITVDSNQQIVMFNKAAEKMFRCTAAEAIGKSMERFIPPRFRPNHAKDIRKFGETGVTTRAMAATRPVSGLRSDGEEFPLEASISQIEVGGQKLYTVIMRDIIEKTRALESLRASELRYRRLFESAKDGILILDSVSGQIVEANPFLIEMLGYPKEELVGKELWEIGSFKDIVASREAFDELQQHGYIRYEDLPLKTREGVTKQVEFVSNSYLAGKVRVIQCNIRDISERKRAEEALKETNQHLKQAMESLQEKTQELTAMTQQLWQASKLATMGELAASVAHELNNPLATVGLRAERLLMQLPERSDQRRPLEIIAQEVDRMATLVNNLLQFSRRGHRQISTLDLSEEIATSVEFLHYHLRNLNIEVVSEFAEGLPSIQADPEQLRQLFLNLITNASDAMPQGGKLTLRAGWNGAGDSAVKIDFVDTGEGIAAANLEKVWEPFFTTKPEGKGTGLGLAICRRIVEEHGGTIRISSELGKGTTIHIVLPATSREVLG
jgi:PAS domain S-box-containing protein